jgi:spermidine synthase
VGTVGATSGKIYSISTVGSIAGVFLTTFLGMPYLGVVETLWAYGLALLAISLVGLRKPGALIIGALLVSASAFAPLRVGGEGVLFEGESVYNYVQVVRSSDGALLLKLNEGIGSQSVYYKGDIYTRGIWDYFLAPLLSKPGAKEVLVIGFAAGTVARQYLALSNASVTGVEIDPLVVDVAREYFDLEESERLKVAIADGRTFLTLRPDKFDIILMDAFNPPTIPFHLATREFFDLVKARLNPGGILAVNVPRYGEPAHVVDPICATMESVFGQVLLVDRRPAIPQLAIASPGGMDLEDFVSEVELNSIGAARRIVSGLVTRTTAFDGNMEMVFTDDRSSIEIQVHKIIFDFAGGEEDVDFD